MTNDYNQINSNSLDDRAETYSLQPARSSYPNVHLVVTSRGDLGAAKSIMDVVVAECSDALIVVAAYASSLVHNFLPLRLPHLATVAQYHHPYLAVACSHSLRKMVVPIVSGQSSDRCSTSVEIEGRILVAILVVRRGLLATYY
jgi:hypothetical protein